MEISKVSGTVVSCFNVAEFWRRDRCIALEGCEESPFVHLLQKLTFYVVTITW